MTFPITDGYLSTATAIVLTALLAAISAHAQEGSRPDTIAPDHRIDHVGVAFASLDEGIRLVEQMTGVRPVPGGEHPGMGTQNALLSLGDGQYLEVIAPAASGASSPFADYLRGLEQPEIVLWAVSTQNPTATAAALGTAGFAATPPQPGSRVTPDGATLQWVTFGAVPEVMAGPFFIQWTEGTVHPSVGAPAGCTLTALEIGVPDVNQLAALLTALEIHVVLTQTAEPTAHLVLACPTGEVRF